SEPADPATGVDSPASARVEEALAAVGDRVSTYPDLNRPEVFQQSGLGWVPWIAPVAEAELTETQREALIEAGRAKNPYFRLLARDPAALKARTLTDLDIFFNTTDGLGRAERELAATAASRLNGCLFCASVHADRATEESGRRDLVQRLLDDGAEASLGDAVWDAVVEASVALTRTPQTFGPSHVTALREAGLANGDIIDVLGCAAFFNWANRLMLSLGEPEVLSAGSRVPRRRVHMRPAGGSTMISRQTTQWIRPQETPLARRWDRTAGQAAYSSAERMMKRLPVGDSTLKPPPRPGTTSRVRWVCFQYSNCSADIQKSSPAFSVSSMGSSKWPSSTSASEVRKSPSGK